MLDEHFKSTIDWHCQLGGCVALVVPFTWLGPDDPDKQAQLQSL